MVPIPCEAMWPHIEEGSQETLNIPGVSKIFRKSSAEERATAFAVGTSIMGVKFLELLAQMRRDSIMEIAVAQHVIPNSESVDKILRYEAAIDRSLGRGLDRLERLQRRRSGERIPPPVSVR